MTVALDDATKASMVFAIHTGVVVVYHVAPPKNHRCLLTATIADDRLSDVVAFNEADVFMEASAVITFVIVEYH